MKRNRIFLIIGVILTPFVIISAFYYPILPIASERIFGMGIVNCPMIPSDENQSETGYKGFTMMLPRYGGEIDEFVLKPGTTGYITKTFEFGNQTANFIEHEMQTTPLIYFSGVQSYYVKVGGDGSSVSPNDTGLSIFVDNQTHSDHKITITYGIRADGSASEASYGLNLHSTCLPEMLTVGDRPYMHSLRGDKLFLY